MIGRVRRLALISKELRGWKRSRGTVIIKELTARDRNVILLISPSILGDRIRARSAEARFSDEVKVVFFLPIVSGSEGDIAIGPSGAVKSSKGDHSLGTGVPEHARKRRDCRWKMQVFYLDSCQVGENSGKSWSMFIDALFSGLSFPSTSPGRKGAAKNPLSLGSGETYGREICMANQ